MLDDDKLLKFIIEKCEELDVKPYELARYTSLSEMGAYNILNGISKKPRRKSLIEIEQYLESKVVGTAIGQEVNEPNEKITENFIKRKMRPHEIFTDVGTELLRSYRRQIEMCERQIGLFEENAGLYRENADLLRFKVSQLEKVSGAH